MDWGGASSLAEPRLLRLLFFLFLLRVLQVCEGCRVENCSRMYNSFQKKKIDKPESSVPFCMILEDFEECLINTSKECRANLIYHSYTTMLNTFWRNHNCTRWIGREIFQVRTHVSRPSVIPKIPENVIPVAVPPSRSCSFHGRHKFQFCGLFGDPHLKTFDSNYQTCKLKGAWPLIDNPHLAVSVTNEPVMENSPATVTTKVTVIIKSRGIYCTQEKTYEAQSDMPLPDSFIDGTQKSEPNESVMLKLREIDKDHQMVEIYLKYIETTLIIRQVGKYLAFAARLPEEVVVVDGEGLQLCSTGCPESERLDLATDHGQAMSWEEALKRCQNTDGLSNEINNQLTDHYLDWCVFDVMTTGEHASAYFTAAAHSAQADVLRFDAESLRNRTTTKLRPRDVNMLSSASTSCTCLLRILITAISFAFFVK